MKKLLVRGAIALGVVIVLLIAAVIVLPLIVPADAYRDRLVAEVKSVTGRDLRIDGPVHVSVLPRLAIEAEKISLSNPPGAQAKEMVTLGKLQAVIELFPLLKGNVVVDKFVLVEPVFAFEVDKQGHANWMLGVPAASGAPASGAPSAPPPAPGGGGGGARGALNSLRLGDVTLQNGTVSYLDQRTGEHAVVDKITMDVSFPDINSPLKVDGSVQYKEVPIAIKMNAGKTIDFITAAGTPVEMTVRSPMIDFDFKGKASMGDTVGTIDLKVPSLRKFSAWSGGSLPAQGAGFGPFALTGKLTLSGVNFKFTDADISLDAIKGKGDVAVDASGPRRVVKGDLTIAALDLNPYLAPAGSGAVGGGGAATSGWSDTPIDVSGLKVADVDFKLTANAIQFRKIHIDRASITAHDVNGKLELDLTDLAAYQGSGKATVNVDGSGAEPALVVAVNVTGVAMQPLLRDTMNVDRLTGKGSLEISATSRGHSERAMISALNGKGSINVANGEITGLDLLKMLNTAASAVGSALSGGGGTTPFSHLTMSYTITNGVLHNNDLRLESPGLQAEGAGTVDLPKREIDYKVTPKVAGLSVPVIIRGPLDNPSYLPDLAGIVKGVGGGAIDTLKGALPIPGVGGGQSSGGGKPSSGGGPAGILNNLFK
ncbi:MAG TPA: AsmA family protein [Stellaceae bacterium]|nr:AsmA family protein [Stellaceae bacterium]